MDRRKVATFFLLANDLELESFCMCFMMVLLMYMYVSWRIRNEDFNEPFTQSQSRRKRKSRLEDNDLARAFGEITSRLFNKLFEKFEKSEINYPKYLAVELERLGFSVTDNLKISKAMRLDPSNVEVFKIIKTDVEKIEFATEFLDN